MPGMQTELEQFFAERQPRDSQPARGFGLITGGQLDGGHILYAISPRMHRALTRVLPYALLLAGVVCWLGWIVWGVILLIPAMRHPKVPYDEPLRSRHYFLSVVTLAIFLLTFAAQPIGDNSLLRYLHVEEWLRFSR